MPTEIPGPKPRLVVGNLFDIQDEVPIRGVQRLVDIYGPIYKLSLGGHNRLFVGGFDLFDELCDETRFYKIPPPALAGDPSKAPRGLFTAASEKDMDWQLAHRILMPAFGPMAIEGMFDGACSTPPRGLSVYPGSRRKETLTLIPHLCRDARYRHADGHEMGQERLGEQGSAHG